MCIETDIIVCEVKAGIVEVLCKNNTPLLHCRWQFVFEPRNEPHIMDTSRSRRKFALLSCDIAHAQTLFSPVPNAYYDPCPRPMAWARVKRG